MNTTALTAHATHQFSQWAKTLCQRGADPTVVARFHCQIILCCFTYTLGLLPPHYWADLFNSDCDWPTRLPQLFTRLLCCPRTHCWQHELNHSILLTPSRLSVTPADTTLLHSLITLDWSIIAPHILGTVFERGMQSFHRAQLGAHYTDPAAIMRVIEPVLLTPLRAEWEMTRRAMIALIETAQATQSANNQHRRQLRVQYVAMRRRLRAVRVLDPACGAGNFLLAALVGLKELEYDMIVEGERLGLIPIRSVVGPQNVLGIEKYPAAAELARVTVWLGDMQWRAQHGDTVLKNRGAAAQIMVTQNDAIIDDNGNEPEWPTAEVIIGNPPFLGGSKKRGVLGDAYCTALKTLYAGRVPARADVVCYWFEKARVQLELGKARTVGLVATQAIRNCTNRGVLERIQRHHRIFHVWSNEQWLNSGAHLRVAFICFGQSTLPTCLNGHRVARIHADLTAPAQPQLDCDVTTAHQLPTNADVCFEGIKKYGAFTIDGALARRWLMATNPTGCSNAMVIKPWWNAHDIMRRNRDQWIIDFGIDMSMETAAQYVEPFQYVQCHVQPQRAQQHNERIRQLWWLHERPRPNMRRLLTQLPRYIATPRVAQQRVFMWCPPAIVPDTRLLVIARADDMTWGLLTSRIHSAWSFATCAWHGGQGATYNAQTCFATFPFPIGLTPIDTAGGIETLASGAIIPRVASPHRQYAIAIAEAAYQFNQLRERWFNPPEWIERVPEVVAGYPERIIAQPEYAGQLKQRTIAHLYRAPPTWLERIQRELDQAVAAAYRWPEPIGELNDAEIVRRLLALNREYAATKYMT